MIIILILNEAQRTRWPYGLVVGLPNNSYKPITNTAWVRARPRILQKKCALNSQPQVIKLTHGRWFSPGTSTSSTTQTGRHDIAEILLKVALKTINQSNINKAYSSEYVVGSPTY
jgi:hypothetical protein